MKERTRFALREDEVMCGGGHSHEGEVQASSWGKVGWVLEGPDTFLSLTCPSPGVSGWYGRWGVRGAAAGVHPLLFTSLTYFWALYLQGPVVGVPTLPSGPITACLISQGPASPQHLPSLAVSSPCCSPHPESHPAGEAEGGPEVSLGPGRSSQLCRTDVPVTWFSGRALKFSKDCSRGPRHFSGP